MVYDYTLYRKFDIFLSLNIQGTKYTHGSIARVVYVSSGSSADWTYGTAGITFSYGVELRDTGKSF